jgi:hypothetical protein
MTRAEKILEKALLAGIKKKYHANRAALHAATALGTIGDPKSVSKHMRKASYHALKVNPKRENKAYAVFQITRKFFEEDAVLTQRSLSKLERALDILYSGVGVEVAFSTHFLGRVNALRNTPPITIGELEKLFRETYKRYGQRLVDDPGPDGEAVIHDLQTDVNVPFVLKVNRQKDLVLLPKTAMRTKNFHAKPWQSRWTVGLAGLKRR